MKIRQKRCPCGSKKSYQDCCCSFIYGGSIPQTPETLMRSRYTAYTKANIGYIEKTMRGPATLNFDVKSAKEWALATHWLGLQVLNSTLNSDDSGTVEFIAKYSLNNKLYSMHEVSEFHKIDGRWYYVDGKLIKQ